MPDDAYDIWLPVDEVTQLLGVQRRQAHRYGEGPQPRVRTKYINGRKLFHKGDVETIVAEKQTRGQVQAKTDLVPASELLMYLQETHDKLNRAMLEIGRLQGQLEAAHDRIKQLEAGSNTPSTLEPATPPAPVQQTGQKHLSWWKRWLLRKTSRHRNDVT